MKRLFVLFLVAVVDLAFADPLNPCNAPASAVKAPYIDLSAAGAGYECAPTPLGNGTMPTVRSNRAGTVAWWYCPSRDGKWHVNWAAATAARMSAGTLFSEVYEVVTAKDPRAAFNAITAKNVKIPLSDPSLTPVWCPFVAEMNSGAPPAAPARNTLEALKSKTPAKLELAERAGPSIPLQKER
jgi:hypothetical protein